MKPFLLRSLLILWSTSAFVLLPKKNGIGLRNIRPSSRSSSSSSSSSLSLSSEASLEGNDSHDGRYQQHGKKSTASRRKPSNQEQQHSSSARSQQHYQKGGSHQHQGSQHPRQQPRRVMPSPFKTRLQGRFVFDTRYYILSNILILNNTPQISVVTISPC